MVRTLLIGSVLALLAVPGRADAAFPGQTGKLVFGARPAMCESNCGRFYRLFLADADGGRPVQIGTLTPMEQAATTSDSGAHFSSDGTRIAFTRSLLDATGSIVSNEIWTMGADGSGVRRVATGVNAAWLPNGRLSYRSPDGAVEVANADGTDAITLLQGFDGSSMAWSPDGRLIAFERGGDIWVMSADGSLQRRLRSTPSLGDGDPEWAPDGSVIAYSCQEPLFNNVCTIRPDGTGFRSVTLSQEPERSSTPVYTPDGATLLITRSTTGVDGAWGPYLMAPTGGAARVMAMPQGWSTGEFEWQPVPRPPAVAAPTPEPTPTPEETQAPVSEPVPAATTPPPAPARSATPSSRIVIPFQSGYKVPGLPRAKACTGKITLTLRKGSRVLARRSVRLNRRCRFGATFQIARSRIGAARSLTVVAHFHGNRLLGASTNRFKVKLPEGT